jgi:hypothetical protein
VHISVTEYTIDWPRIIVVSVQDVMFRDSDTQALSETVDDPVTLVTFHDEKLQYEFEHELAPAVQLTVTEPNKDRAEVVTPVRDMDEGELALIKALEHEGALSNPGHVHPSTTVYTYALFGATLDKVH